MRWIGYTNSCEFYVNKIAVNNIVHSSAGLCYTPFVLHLYTQQLKITHKFLKIYCEQTDYPIGIVLRPTKQVKENIF
jgi:hypothetical protein